MIIELLKNHRFEGGGLYKKGTILNVHPSDGNELVKKKIAIEPHLKIKENGNNGKN